MLSSKSIRTQLLSYLLFLLLIFSLTTTLFWVDRYQAILSSSFEAQTKITQDSVKTPLAAALWNYDETAANDALQALEEVQFFVGAQVFSDTEIFSQHSRNNINYKDIEIDYNQLDRYMLSIGDTKVVVFPLLSQDGDRLGTVRMDFDYSFLREQLWRTTGLAVVISLALFFAAGCFVALCVSSIIRPIRSLLLDLGRLRSGELDITVSGLSRGDEIGQLAGAVEEVRLANQAQLEVTEQELRRREAAAREAEERQRADEAARQEQEKLKEEARQKELDHEASMRKERAITAAQQKKFADEQSFVVGSLANGLQNLAAGVLSDRLVDDFPETYESLKQDFNHAVDTLRLTVEQIRESSQIIKGSAFEISGAATSLSARTEKSAAHLEETSASLTELTELVQSMATSADHTKALVMSTQNDTDMGKEIVRDAVKAMQQISESSKQITSITEITDQIAFQTNLLALNASVEAARAGDSGRGFAVVASEVRALAQRSADASKQITNLIYESSEQVQRGVNLIELTDQRLAQIFRAFKEISQNVEDIASSANDQSMTITSINAAVTDLDQTTQNNAAMFEETMTACNSLDEEASNLHNLVQVFELENNERSDGRITERTFKNAFKATSNC